MTSYVYADYKVPIYVYDPEGKLQDTGEITVNDSETSPSPPIIIDNTTPKNNHRHHNEESVNPITVETQEEIFPETPILLDNNPNSIHSEAEKTIPNIMKYFQYKLDDSYSDKFINAVSEFGYDVASWKHFYANNTKPLSFSHMMNSVVLPFKRGGNDVYNISEDRNTWIDKEGIQYSKNSYDSFFRITPINSEKKCDDTPTLMIRSHCNFGKIVQYEKDRAINTLKSIDKRIFTKSYAEINNTFAYAFPDIDSRTQFLIDHNLLEFARGIKSVQNQTSQLPVD